MFLWLSITDMCIYSMILGLALPLCPLLLAELADFKYDSIVVHLGKQVEFCGRIGAIYIVAPQPTIAENSWDQGYGIKRSYTCIAAKDCLVLISG